MQTAGARVVVKEMDDMPVSLLFDDDLHGRRGLRPDQRLLDQEVREILCDLE